MPFSSARIAPVSRLFPAEKPASPQAQQRPAPVTIDAQMLQKRKCRRRLGAGSGVPDYGIVRREKYNARPAALTTTFTTFGNAVFRRVGQGRGGGGHFRALQTARHRVHHGGVEQRFVALDVDHRVARAIPRHFGDAVRAAGMVRGRSFPRGKNSAPPPRSACRRWPR